MNKKEKYTAIQLIDYCVEETIIECQNCGLQYGTQETAENSVDDFFADGWRATKNKVYCPKCAKKKLKL